MVGFELWKLKTAYNEKFMYSWPGSDGVTQRFSNYGFEFGSWGFPWPNKNKNKSNFTPGHQNPCPFSIFISVWSRFQRTLVAIKSHYQSTLCVLCPKITPYFNILCEAKQAQTITSYFFCFGSRKILMLKFGSPGKKFENPWCNTNGLYAVKATS